MHSIFRPLHRNVNRQSFPESLTVYPKSHCQYEAPLPLAPLSGEQRTATDNDQLIALDRCVSIAS